MHRKKWPRGTKRKKEAENKLFKPRNSNKQITIVVLALIILLLYYW